MPKFVVVVVMAIIASAFMESSGCGMQIEALVEHWARERCSTCDPICSLTPDHDQSAVEIEKKRQRH